MKYKLFNLCSNGILKYLLAAVTIGVNICLNPCSNGILKYNLSRYGNGDCQS